MSITVNPINAKQALENTYQVLLSEGLEEILQAIFKEIEDASKKGATSIIFKIETSWEMYSYVAEYLKKLSYKIKTDYSLNRLGIYWC